MSFITHWRLFGRAACDPVANRVIPSEHLSAGAAVDCEKCLPLLQQTRASLDRKTRQQRLDAQQRDHNERALSVRGTRG